MNPTTAAWVCDRLSIKQRETLVRVARKNLPVSRQSLRSLIAAGLYADQQPTQEGRAVIRAMAAHD